MAYTVNSYNNKYKGVDNRLSVMEVLQRVGSTEYRESAIKEYEAVDMAEVKINGNRFRNYGQYSFIWEKTYPKAPERSMGGSIGNLNSLATFLTPHLILDFSVMSIDDYRKIMKLHYGANEFTVECYDTIFDGKIKVKMYFATEEIAKLFTIAQNRLLPDGQWEEWVDLVGVTEYKVELIGTNNDLDLVSVKYVYSENDANGKPIYVAPNGAPMPPQYEEDVYLGEEIIIGASSTFQDTPPTAQLKFKHWVDFKGKIYTNGVVLTVNSPLTLYAVWEATTTYSLSFNYGLSDVDYTVTNGIREDILNREVRQNSDIGRLPSITSEPSVLYNGELQYPYYNGAWYRDPNKTTRVDNHDLYWTNRSTIIYALYDKKPFTVSYVTGLYDLIVPTQTVYYGDQVYLPTLARDGYNFQGWYLDSAFQKAFGGTMPPYSITLYARWVAK